MISESSPLIPGDELVKPGLEDLSQGRLTMAALLVLIGAPRLRRLGIQIPLLHKAPSEPEHALYDQLVTENPRTAHSRYNALIQRLVSYERELERQHSRDQKENS